MDILKSARLRSDGWSMRRVTPLLLSLLVLAIPAPAAFANASKADWPQISGMLLINKANTNRPLDGRPGHDPFDGSDPTYSCDQVHQSTFCIASKPDDGFVSANDKGGRHTYDAGDLTDNLVPDNVGHNELLGGHGNNTIHAGDEGDVIWGDFWPSGWKATQVNHLYGGPGDDVIYAAHGTSYIWTGSGHDIVHAHFGRGTITCGDPSDIVYLSHRSEHHYALHGCEHISYKSAR